MLSLLLALAPCSIQDSPPPRVEITRSPAVGLGAESGISRSGPSEVLRVGELDYVFYTRSERGAVHYPRKYTGRIWYATSADGGHTWSERGVALDHGPPESFDGLGVFDPSVVRDGTGAILLFYAAIGPPFNLRFERTRHLGERSIGVAELSILGGEVTARRLTTAPVLSPSAKRERGFDSLQVEDPSVIARGGQFLLYYRGRGFPEFDDRTAMGLATSTLPTGPFHRRPSRAPALAFARDTLVWPFERGTLALVTSSERGLYWALDGAHFARVLERVEGSLNEPGLARPEEPGARRLWGIHVARTAPEPFLERFELELVGELSPPPLTTLPVPRLDGDATVLGWSHGATWMDQHSDILELARRRPKDVVFLGDRVAQGWGGAGRAVAAPGQAAFAEHFGASDTANFGIAGDRTENVLWRIGEGEFLRGRSKVVVLSVGAAHIGVDPPEDIEAGVYAILNQLRRLQPEGEVLLLGLLPRDAATNPEGALLVRETNERLRRLDDLARVTYLDVGETYANEAGAVNSRLLGADGVSLTAEGYERLAEVLHLPVSRLARPPQLR